MPRYIAQNYLDEVTQSFHNEVSRVLLSEDIPMLGLMPINLKVNYCCEHLCFEEETESGELRATSEEIKKELQSLSNTFLEANNNELEWYDSSHGHQLPPPLPPPSSPQTPRYTNCKSEFSHWLPCELEFDGESPTLSDKLSGVFIDVCEGDIRGTGRIYHQLLIEEMLLVDFSRRCSLPLVKDLQQRLKTMPVQDPLQSELSGSAILSETMIFRNDIDIPELMPASQNANQNYIILHEDIRDIEPLTISERYNLEEPLNYLTIPSHSNELAQMTESVVQSIVKWDDSVDVNKENSEAPVKDYLNELAPKVNLAEHMSISHPDFSVPFLQLNHSETQMLPDGKVTHSLESPLVDNSVFTAFEHYHATLEEVKATDKISDELTEPGEALITFPLSQRSEAELLGNLWQKELSLSKVPLFRLPESHLKPCNTHDCLEMMHPTSARDSLLLRAEEMASLELQLQWDPFLPYYSKMCEANKSDFKTLQPPSQLLETEDAVDCFAEYQLDYLGTNQKDTDFLDQPKILNQPLSQLPVNDVQQEKLKDEVENEIELQFVQSATERRNPQKMSALTCDMRSSKDDWLQLMDPLNRFLILRHSSMKIGEVQKKLCAKPDVCSALVAVVQPCVTSNNRTLDNEKNKDDVTDGELISKSLQPLTVVVSQKLTSDKQELIRLLETKYNIMTIDRDYAILGNSAGYFEDVTVDENTTIIIQDLVELQEKHIMEGLVMRVNGLKQKSSACWVILFSSLNLGDHNVYSSSIINISKLQASCSVLSENDFLIKVIFCHSYKSVAEYVRQIAKQTISKRNEFSLRNLSRITREPTKSELFLLSFPCLNSISAQMLLEVGSLKNLLLMRKQEICANCQSLPDKVLEAFHEFCISIGEIFLTIMSAQSTGFRLLPGAEDDSNKDIFLSKGSLPLELMNTRNEPVQISDEEDDEMICTARISASPKLNEFQKAELFGKQIYTSGFHGNSRAKNLVANSREETEGNYFGKESFCCLVTLPLMESGMTGVHKQTAEKLKRKNTSDLRMGGNGVKFMKADQSKSYWPADESMRSSTTDPKMAKTSPRGKTVFPKKSFGEPFLKNNTFNSHNFKPFKGFKENFSETQFNCSTIKKQLVDNISTVVHRCSPQEEDVWKSERSVDFTVTSGCHSREFQSSTAYIELNSIKPVESRIVKKPSILSSTCFTSQPIEAPAVDIEDITPHFKQTAKPLMPSSENTSDDFTARQCHQQPQKQQQQWWWQQTPSYAKEAADKNISLEKGNRLKPFQWSSHQSQTPIIVQVTGVKQQRLTFVKDSSSKSGQTKLKFI